MSAWHILRTVNTITGADFGPGLGVESFPEPKGDGPLVHLILDADRPANVLTSDVLEELRDLLPILEELSGVEALFLWSAKAKHFIAGANVEEIEAIRFPETGSAKAAEGQRLFQALAALPYPTFAMIRGTCLGGGLELCLALDYRIAVDDPTTKIGLPEIKLGIIPGFGGCQRLPRLIGLRSGLALIVAGSRLPAKVAFKKGVVDELVPAEGHRATAVQAALAIVKDGGARVRKRRRARTKGFLSAVLERTAPGRLLIARAAHRQVQAKTGGHYPAGPAAVDVVVKGFGRSLAAGLELENEHVGELIASDVSKNLIAIFQDSEKARRQAVVTEDESQGAWPESPFVGVLGAGIMGAGIAELLLTQGCEVRLRDLEAEPLRKGLAHIGSELAQRVKSRRIDARERDGILARLTHTTGIDGFGRSDAVIEAIVERLDIKRAALAELEPRLREDALFLTNTSALSVTDIQKEARHPERVVGLHFFNPVAKMPLVEVIAGKQTAPWAVARTVQLSQELGKYPVVVQDSPGFLVNRLLFPYLDSACRLLERGVSGEAVDRIARAFGLPMGPFRLIDEVGVDIGVEVAGTLHRAFGDRLRPAEPLQQLLDKGWLGRKSGVGFYRYPEGKGKPTWNPELSAGSDGSPDPDEVIPFLLDPVVDEAARCLEEGIVEGPSQVDLAMVMGTGFPPFLGGPLRAADKQGLASLVDRLRQRAESGERVPPSEYLVKLASSRPGFYSLERQENPVEEVTP